MTGSTGLSEVVAVGSGGALDETEASQAAGFGRDSARRRELLQKRGQVGAADAGDGELGVLQRAKQSALRGIEDVTP